MKDNRLLVGGPSITDPIERSKGFQYALLSYHHDHEALSAYQASKEHHEYGDLSFLATRVMLSLADFLQSDFQTYVPLQGGPDQVRLRGRT